MIYRPWTYADKVATVGLLALCVVLLGVIFYLGIQR